jgi:hypothetical protein
LRSSGGRDYRVASQLVRYHACLSKPHKSHDRGNEDAENNAPDHIAKSSRAQRRMETFAADLFVAAVRPPIVEPAVVKVQIAAELVARFATPRGRPIAAVTSRIAFRWSCCRLIGMPTLRAGFLLRRYLAAAGGAGNEMHNWYSLGNE